MMAKSLLSAVRCQTRYLRRTSARLSGLLARPRFNAAKVCFSTSNTTTSGEDAQFRADPADAPSMLDIGTRQIFTEDHDIFRRSVRRFYQEEIVPHQMRWEKQGYVDREVRGHKAGAQGLLCIDTPTEIGGLGGDYLFDAIVLEEQLYINDLNCGFPIQSQAWMPYLVHYGTREQLDKYLPRCLSGDVILAMAMTEPSAGSDLQGIRTRAKQDGDDWILNGSKIFVSNGYLCDVVIVVAVTNPEAKSPAHGFSLFLVEDGTEGFTKGKPLDKMGCRGQDTAEHFYDEVRLPKSALLGEVNKGFSYLMERLPQERLGVGVATVSHSEWMFEETRAYVKERKAFGKTLADLQTIQHKLAEMKTEICIGRSFIDKCILLNSEGRLSAQMASMAKLWGSSLGYRVADQCLQLHGGWGYMTEMPISRAFTLERLQRIYGGSNEIMKELIAREIVKK